MTDIDVAFAPFPSQESKVAVGACKMSSRTEKQRGYMSEKRDNQRTKHNQCTFSKNLLARAKCLFHNPEDACSLDGVDSTGCKSLPAVLCGDLADAKDGLAGVPRRARESSRAV